jgi:hypothetical protein
VPEPLHPDLLENPFKKHVKLSFTKSHAPLPPAILRSLKVNPWRVVCLKLLKVTPKPWRTSERTLLLLC